MNANELAKMLFHYWNKTENVEIPSTLMNDAADMLRKQAEEIEYWKEMFEKAMKTQELDKHWERHL